MSLFTNPTPLTYTQANNGVEVQQRWTQPQPIQNAQTNLENNPYTNAINELNSCSGLLKNSILNDPEYVNIENQVERLFLQYLYAQALPLVLQNQQHNFLLEEYYQTVKSLKNKHEEHQRIKEQQVIQAQEQMNLLMQDPVISKRLLELQSNQAQEMPEKTEHKKDYKKGGK